MDYQAPATKVIQVTNIAPQATRDQMHTLFSFLGKIEDLRLYPSLRDASVTIQSRCCFLKFLDEGVLPISLHMTNTVFIDRAIIVQPFMNNDIPDELSGLEFANQASRNITGENRLPPHVHNETSLDGMIYTKDMPLYQTGLPPFPPLPGATEPKQVEEIRRTLIVMGIAKDTTAQDVMQYFGTGAGEVKYFRWCGKDGLETEDETGRDALLEFTDYGAVIPAMRLNNTKMGEATIKVYYSCQAITKPKAKSNEDSLREIEEAMKKVKEAQSLVSATVDPLMGLLSKKSRSRSRDRSTNDRDYYASSMGGRRRSRSRERYRRRSRSRDRRRRSRSRDRYKRSRSRDSRRKRSKSRKKSRSRSKDRKKETSSKEVKSEDTKNGDEANGDTAVKNEGENGTVKDEKVRSRSKSKSKSKKKERSRSRKRSRSRSRKRSKRSRSRRKSRSRDRRRKSRSRSRDRKRSRSRDHKKKSKKERRSRDRDEKKEITRDYDQEEAGYEQGGKTKEEKLESVDMEISNSP